MAESDLVIGGSVDEQSTGGWITRAGWGLAGQLVSSFSNFLLGVSVARSADTAEFGAFSVGYFGYLFALGLVRAVVSDPILIGLSGDASGLRTSRRQAAGLSLALGVPLGVGIGGLAALAPGSPVVLAFAVTAPLLMLQDVMRYIFIAQGEPSRSFVCDVLWLAAFIVGWFTLANRAQTTSTMLVLCWGISGGASAAAGLYLARCTPGMPKVKLWIHNQGHLIRGLLGEFVATAGLVRLGAIVMPAVIGISAYGGYRLADLALGPMNVFLVAALSVGVAEIRRKLGSWRLVHTAALVSGSLAVLALLYGLLLLALPNDWPEFLFGSGWSVAVPVVGILVLERIAASAGFGALVVLRVMKRTSSAAALRATGAIAGLGLALLGGTIASSRGVAAGYAAASGLTTLLLWVSLARSGDRGRAVKGAELDIGSATKADGHPK